MGAQGAAWSSHRAGGGARRGRRSTVTSLGPSSKEIRDWARSNGYDVSDRGRVSAEIRQAFEAAQ